jgi:uncharacterized protein involved in oxidation of intracellular sulfur
MKYLMILNDPPYGTERTYNGLRLALNLLKYKEDVSLKMFLMADATAAAKTGQITPDGFYNLERMMKGVIKRGAGVFLCGTCMDARGLTESDILDGSSKSTMDELTRLTIEADKVLVF